MRALWGLDPIIRLIFQPQQRKRECMKGSGAEGERGNIRATATNRGQEWEAWRNRGEIDWMEKKDDLNSDFERWAVQLA